MDETDLSIKPYKAAPDDSWLDSQTRVLEKRYIELGGEVTVIVREGAGHLPTAAKDTKPVVEYIMRRQAANAP
jgi:hypothetical protein